MPPVSSCALDCRSRRCSRTFTMSQMNYAQWKLAKYNGEAHWIVLMNWSSSIRQTGVLKRSVNASNVYTVPQPTRGSMLMKSSRFIEDSDVFIQG